MVSRLVRSLARRDAYRTLRAKFLGNGGNRQDIVARFETIDANVPIESTPAEGLLMAEMLLNTDARGPVVECGCYAGGSTAKLSVLAHRLGRQLIVCDSFEGLPGDRPTVDLAVRRRNRTWTRGQFSAGLETVQRYVARYGEPSVCCYVRGWFENTLEAELPNEVSFAFTDVDRVDSARTCLTAIWPRLSQRGVYVTHDTGFIGVLLAMQDRNLWLDNFKDVPPVLFGAGYGLSDYAASMGYLVKSSDAAYLKRLTVSK